MSGSSLVSPKYFWVLKGGTGLVFFDCKSKYFVFYRPRVQTYQYQDVPGVKRHIGGNASPNASRDNGETNVNKDAEWFVWSLARIRLRLVEAIREAKRLHCNRCRWSMQHKHYCCASTILQGKKKPGDIRPLGSPFLHQEWENPYFLPSALTGFLSSLIYYLP